MCLTMNAFQQHKVDVSRVLAMLVIRATRFVNSALIPLELKNVSANLMQQVIILVLVLILHTGCGTLA